MPKLNILLSLILIFGLFSCKEEAKEFEELAEDISYTDSFSPASWENPLGRQTVTSGDKDIGQFIPEDILDPELRNLLNLFQSLFRFLQQQQVSKTESLLTESAYNSLRLRFTQSNLSRKYQLRISIPPQPLETRFSIQCKIIQNNG
ncbi:MAG: hypothetical protein MJB14_03375, partial [Spirochaetes bacterium]|nr:hypothetical protein [Spirochaetota bacterium]